jgi:hypothetical protein
MVGELSFYLATILICTGYPLLMQSYPQWRIYISIGFAGFIISGAVFTYLEAKEKGEDQAKIGQLESMLEDAKKETQKQENLVKDAAKKSFVLAEQLRRKTEEVRNQLQEQPQIVGKIDKVTLFPWQRQSASRTPADDMATTIGILVFAHIANGGSATPLANWELNIELPDNTIIRPQKWPVQKPMRIQCEDGVINISKGEYLDAKSKQALQKKEERSGVTIWMIKNIPFTTIRTKDSVYTLTVRDNAGVVHALERFDLASLPQKCTGFDID